MEDYTFTTHKKEGFINSRLWWRAIRAGSFLDCLGNHHHTCLGGMMLRSMRRGITNAGDFFTSEGGLILTIWFILAFVYLAGGYNLMMQAREEYFTKNRFMALSILGELGLLISTYMFYSGYICLVQARKVSNRRDVLFVVLISLMITIAILFMPSFS